MPRSDSHLPGSSLGRDAWRRLRRNHMAVFGLCVFVGLATACVFGPMLSPYSCEQMDPDYGARGPTASHWLGTDDLGRDLLTRILHGGRISISVGFVATGVSLCIGVAYGAISGFAGGKVDAAMMRAVDVLYALPFMVFVILLTVAFGRDIRLLFVAIGAVQWPTMARIVRAQVQALRHREFVEAAFALGLGRARIIVRHILPNVVGPVVVYATLTVPAVMLMESMLSFLGLGVQAPMSSWGLLIQQGADKMETYPWLLVFPAICFSLTLFSLNFLGDGLRDALDPQSAKD